MKLFKITYGKKYHDYAGICFAEDEDHAKEVFKREEPESRLDEIEELEWKGEDIITSSGFVYVQIVHQECQCGYQ